MSHDLTHIYSDGNPTKLVLSWEYIDHACDDLVDQMLRDAFVPKRIIGLTRGGLIPAVILSHKMRVPMSALDWQTRDGTIRERLKLETLLEDLEDGDKALVVDDIADSGRTLAQLKAAVPAELESKMVFAAVVYKDSSIMKPHYFSTFHAVREDEDVWFVFPWESTYSPSSRLERRD